MKRKNTLGLAIAALLADAPAMVLRNDLTAEGRELLSALNKTTDEVKNLALDAQKKAGDLGESLRAEIDKGLTAQGEMRAQLTELQQHIAAQLTAAPAQPQTLGARFVAEASVKAALAAGPQGFGAGSQISASFADVSLRNAVSSGASSAGPLKIAEYLPGIIPPGLQQLRIRDLLSWGQTSQAAVTYFREKSRTNNAAPVSELTTMAVSDIDFEAATANVINIAHSLRASEQVLADVPALLSYIDGQLMRYGIKLKEEAQLLKGSGVGNNMTGLYSAASAYSNPGVTVVSENRMDRLRLAILQTELSGYQADGIVLSPIDWVQIELLKTASDKQYLVGNPFGTIVPTLWSRPVVASQSMTAGTYLVGAFGVAAQGWDRQQATVEVGRSGTDFVDQAVTIRCVERLALAIYKADALIKGSFGSVA